MGQFRISIYQQWQIGFSITLTSEDFRLHLPFMTIYVATTGYARGFYIFGKMF
jgi:hypothetical protein